jgi:hypothetical protein
LKNSRTQFATEEKDHLSLKIVNQAYGKGNSWDDELTIVNRELITACWNPDPSKRPSFKEIITQLDYIIVDCVIRDQKGRKFWKDNFLKKEEVPWTEFLDKFLKLVPVSNEQKDLDIRCLHSILGK